ncbi:MAG: sigma-70 family RNA polymerase sigma factor [Ruminococcus sp.]|nr:sigma-70 family RNA polymerase sigma factor [Ruminococcus sp.]
MTGNELKALTGSSPNQWHRIFYDEYKNYVHTIVFNRLRRVAFEQDIEECVSDVFTDIFLNADRFFDMKDVRGFVGLVAKRKAVSYYRRLCDKRGGYDKVEDIAYDSDMEADAEQKELAQTVLSCITALGQPDSAIILLKYYYGLTSAQIGKKLGMKPSAVRKRSGRALNKLRELLSAKGIDGKDL